MSSRYAYTQLSGSAIRLIQVQPQRPGLLLSCKIFHATQSSEYKALSYVVGDQSKRIAILLNGLDFDVGPNLYEFLQLASVRFPNVPLWVDELCIHQSNLAERNQQVQQIGDIYRNAQYVIAWLGSAGYPGSLLFDEAVKLESLLGPPEANGRDVYVGQLSTLRARSIVTAIKDLCDLTYFTRLWVYQEFIVAREVLMVRGRYEVNASTLVPYLVKFTSIAPDPHAEHAFLNCDSLYDVRSSRGFPILNQLSLGSPTLDLDELLGPSFDGQCTEWRDRVFGLLSLCLQKSLIRVNYADSPEELIIRLLIACEQSKMKKAIQVFLHLYRIYQVYNVKYFWHGSSLDRNLIERYKDISDKPPERFANQLPLCSKKSLGSNEGPLQIRATITCAYCFRTLVGNGETPLYLLCMQGGKIHAAFWELGAGESKSVVHIVDVNKASSSMCTIPSDQLTAKVVYAGGIHHSIVVGLCVSSWTLEMISEGVKLAGRAVLFAVGTPILGLLYLFGRCFS